MPKFKLFPSLIWAVVLKMQGNPPQFEEHGQEHRRDSKTSLSDRSSGSPMSKSLRVTSLSPSRLPKGFRSQTLAREELSPTIKSRLKHQQSPTSQKLAENSTASGLTRDPCADVIYLKQMLQASIDRLQEMENDKHERYERWKQGSYASEFY